MKLINALMLTALIALVQLAAIAPLPSAAQETPPAESSATIAAEDPRRLQ